MGGGVRWHSRLANMIYKPDDITWIIEDHNRRTELRLQIVLQPLHVYHCT